MCTVYTMYLIHLICKERGDIEISIQTIHIIFSIYMTHEHHIANAVYLLINQPPMKKYGT